MKRKIYVIIVTILLVNSKSFSQTNSLNSKKWGIETELVQPFLPNVGIIRIQATYTLTAASKKRGDLLLGAYLRPNTKHDVVEKINEYLFITGYRQYLWKGLHLEAKSNIGYAWGTKNLIDGKDYNNFSWFWESNLGYKFDFAKKEKTNLYSIAQFGALGKVSADIGPRGGKADNFIQGNLIIGINF
jgi:hypothetical protein